MSLTRNAPDADQWILQMFSARAVAAGGIIRRRAADVDRLIGSDRLLQKVRQRGYQLVESAGQFVIFCNRDPIRLLH